MAQKKSAKKKSAKKSTAKKKAATKSAKRSKKKTLKNPLLFPFRFISKITRKLPKIIKWPMRLALSGGLIATVLGIFVLLAHFALSYRYDLNEVSQMPARTEILNREGNILKNSRGQEIGYLHGSNRRIVRYSDHPKHLIDAIIAQEDRRFRKHGAVDFRSMGRVVFRALTRGKLEGGGTISMQLARNSYSLKKNNEGKLRGMHRKILEIFIAVRIESKFSKDEILEHYMNRIFWGGSIHGVETAARAYFNKSTSELTLGQSALLVGIIRAPNRFNPIRHPKRAAEQRDWVLRKMVENNAITQEEADAAKAAPLNIANSTTQLQQGSYGLDAIRRDLDRILEQEDIKDGGLVIETTLDPNIQELAEKAVEKRLQEVENRFGFPHQKRSQWNGRGDPTYVQGAAVVIDNNSGAILAVVGGRNANESQFNRAIQSRRQIGSLFKPFMFLAAFDNGVKPTDRVSDARLRPGEISGGDPNWNPVNSDGQYHSSIPVSQALIQSRNTSAIRVASVAGLSSVIEVARTAGFKTDNISHVPSSYLGSWGASPEAVASAYTIFPNGGTRYRPYYIQSIKDRKGNTLWSNGPIPYRATPAEPAWEVSRILEEVNRTGTARDTRNKYGFHTPSGGKTGTTNGPTDGWYAGYTSALTCAVWVGMDKNETILKNSSGATLALPIWIDIMKGADRLPYIQNGPIAESRPPLAIPVNPPTIQNIPRAIPVQEEIPRAIPVQEEIPRAVIVDERN